MANNNDNQTQEQKYLDELQKSGTTMLGVTPALVRKFGLGVGQARGILVEWLERRSKQTGKNANAGKGRR